MTHVTVQEGSRISGETRPTFRLDALSRAGFDVAQLPCSVRILFENPRRNEDGVTVTREDIEALAGWHARGRAARGIAFTPARAATC